MTSTNGRTTGAIDFNLHDLVSIRLVGASARDAKAVGRQLGPIRRPFDGEPDVTIEFVDRLETRGTLRFLGKDEAAFTDDAFIVLRSKHKSRARVQIPMERVGEPLTIVAERGVPAIPLLIPIINLTALAKGALPLHASAFLYNGMGVLNTGWSKGGKTEALLGFMEHGARYVGDEWVYLSADGATMSGIPEPIRVWDWYLEQMPRYRALAGRADRLRISGVKAVIGLEGRLPNVPGKRALGRLARLLERQLCVDLPPEKVFPREAFALTGPLDTIFFVASVDAPGVRTRPLTSEEVAERMVFSLQYERLPFMEYYHMFRFAFPERRNTLIESAEALQRERLRSVLANKPCFLVEHPYPAVIEDLYRAMQPLIAKAGQPEPEEA